MSTTLRGGAAVVGIGLAGIPSGKGRTHLELIADAVNKALEDSGLSRDERAKLQDVLRRRKRG